MRTTTPPSKEGAYWYWHDYAGHPEDHRLFWVHDAEDVGVWVATECTCCDASEYVVEMPGTWEGPLQPQGEPNLAAMKRAFVEAWPWLEDAIRLGKQGRTTSLWGEPALAPTGYKAARGTIVPPEGAEKPEVTIRRMRDAWGEG